MKNGRKFIRRLFRLLCPVFWADGEKKSEAEHQAR